jgi:diacylglycerol kinase (ATP)
MTRKFLLLYNPVSGKGDTPKILNAYKSFEQKHTEHKFYRLETDAKAIYNEVAALVQTKNITDIIIAGGDGTVNQVVYALQKLPVQFGIVPRGSGNGLALAAGIPKGYAKALKFILDNPIAKPTDAFLVNNKFACMLIGLGFDGQVAADFAISPTRGLTTYAKLSLQNFIKAKAYNFNLKTTDLNVNVKSYLTCVANSNQFGNRFTIAPKAKLDDGLLDVVVIGEMNKLLLVFRTLKQVAGFNKLLHVENMDAKKSILYFQTAELHITNLQKAPLHIDGEAVATAEDLKIKILPNFFNLIRK